MLTEIEKEDLYHKHKGIVFYVAYKFRFLDKDIEEIRGWGFVGFVKAINQYEKNLEWDFSSIAFTAVKKEIIKNYLKRGSVPKSQSMQEMAYVGKEGKGKTVEEFLVDENQLSFGIVDISVMIKEALFEETEKNRRMILDYLLAGKEADVIAKEYKTTSVVFRKVLRRGQALIKQYLVNNDVILDYLMYPSDDTKKEKKIINHKEISRDDYGKFKYIFKSFPYLRTTEIAILLNTSSYAVSNLLDYPTAAYYKAKADDSIKQKVLQYVKKKYPERLAGELTITSSKAN
ncbi:sigma-70 family RNA polymerase sigma factor [Bacillus mesophilum]|uniref:Sigma-70 family RNA polymerase sigma factor n=1 Tax=Bacillus mesophilum TaxID=1071718 RepID=A0A7V7RNW6_9BACI|nr:sigma-70 family RNA polymerase sigma factor [Bacillus mesophilum]KAB2334276.1 sigma-70 family RNA polymerase sigma factor [Bacillus mesophilum]